MSGNNFQKKEFISGVAFIVLNLAILILGTWFLTSKIITDSYQLREKKSNIELLQQAWQEARNDRKELQRVRPELEKADESFFSKQQPIEFINLLENLAQKTNNLYDIQLVTLGKQEKEGEKELTFQIYLAGSFENFMHFLKYLENMKYYVQVESLQISATGGEGMSRSKWENIPPGSVFSILNIKVFTR